MKTLKRSGFATAEVLLFVFGGTVLTTIGCWLLYFFSGRQEALSLALMGSYMVLLVVVPSALIWLLCNISWRQQKKDNQQDQQDD